MLPRHAKWAGQAPLAAAVLLAALCGCDKRQVEETVNTGVQQATQVVQQSVETVKQEANLAGSMELSTNPPLSAKACYAKLIVVGEGRPSVFRLASYKSVDLERFPSMMLQAQVKANSVSELAGQTVHAEVFAQSKEDDPVWHSPSGSPAAVKIGAINGNTITCECSGAPLVSSETGERSTVTGKFVAQLE